MKMLITKNLGADQMKALRVRVGETWMAFCRWDKTLFDTRVRNNKMQMSNEHRSIAVTEMGNYVHGQSFAILTKIPRRLDINSEFLAEFSAIQSLGLYHQTDADSTVFQSKLCDCHTRLTNSSRKSYALFGSRSRVGVKNSAY